jgi:hypothetical protein
MNSRSHFPVTNIWPGAKELPCQFADILKRKTSLNPKKPPLYVRSLTTFEDVGIVDRQDILTTLVARKLVELAGAGERDSRRLKQRTLRAFERRKPS